jgi:hypothetical protein
MLRRKRAFKAGGILRAFSADSIRIVPEPHIGSNSSVSLAHARKVCKARCQRFFYWRKVGFQAVAALIKTGTDVSSITVTSFFRMEN